MNDTIRLETVNHIDDIDTNTHKYLDLVRRLEKAEFAFATSPATATELAKSSEGTPTDKLLYRASVLDEDGELQTALHKAEVSFKNVSRLYVGGAFVLGFVGAIGLLSTHIINFFYVLIGLLGWHTITLILWMIGLKNTNPYSSIYGVFDKIRPKSPIHAHAFDIYLEEFGQNGTWQIGKLIHKSWLFGLLGSLLALFMLFLFKSYVFVWESTLLSPKHFIMMLKFFGFIPSLFGFDPTQIDPVSGDISHARLATLIMMSIVIYGMIPRLCVYLICHFKANWHFCIDTNLYYYENLIRIFSQKIIDKDDFTPTPIKANNPISPSKNKIVVATLERTSPDDTWHGQGFYAKQVGAVDTKEDITHLLTTARTMEAKIILGIDCMILPDRGVLRKLDIICQHSQYGVAVKLLRSDEDYHTAWQQALMARHIEQLV